MMDSSGAMEDGPTGSDLDAEAVAFMLGIGLCPGSSCPLARRGCDPRCPALVVWVEGISRG